MSNYLTNDRSTPLMLERFKECPCCKQHHWTGVIPECCVRKMKGEIDEIDY